MQTRVHSICIRWPFQSSPRWGQGAQVTDPFHFSWSSLTRLGLYSHFTSPFWCSPRRQGLRSHWSSLWVRALLFGGNTRRSLPAPLHSCTPLTLPVCRCLPIKGIKSILVSHDQNWVNILVCYFAFCWGLALLLIVHGPALYTRHCSICTCCTCAFNICGVWGAWLGCTVTLMGTP